MNVVTRRALQAFWTAHRDAKKPLSVWHRLVRAARWTRATDVTEAFPNVSVLSNNRFAFNIKGNDYGLIVKIHFKTKTVFVRFVGTHVEYDDIDANEV